MLLSLRLQVTALGTLLVCGLLWALGWSQSERMSGDYRAMLLAQQEDLAAQVAETIGGALQTHLLMLERSAGLLLEGDLPAPPVQATARMQRLGAALPMFDALGLLTERGEWLPVDPRHADTATPPWHDAVLPQRVLSTGQPAVSTVLHAAGRGPALLMAVPVQGSSGRVAAVLAGLLPLQHAELLGRLAAGPPPGHLELVSGGEQPVYLLHPDPARRLAAADDARQPAAGLVTRRSLHGVDWELRAVLPALQAEAPLAAARQRLFGQLALGAAAAAALLWFGLGRLLPAGPRRDMPGHPPPDPLPEPLPDPLPDLLQKQPPAQPHELQRLQAELQALQARHAELHAVLDASPIGLFRSDAQGFITHANQAYLDLHELPPKALADGWLHLVPPAERAATWAEWQAAVRREQPTSTIHALERAGGRPLHLLVRTAPLRLPAGRHGHVGAVLDISERMQAKATASRLSAIAEATSDFLVLTDRAGRLTYLNPAAAAGLGLRPPQEGRPGPPLSELMPPASHRLLRSTALRTVRQGGAWLGETVLLGPQGQELPVSHMLIAHRNARGRIVQFSSVMRDVSADRAARRELQRQAATLHSVARAVPAIVAVVGADIVYRFANAGFERWSGQPSERIIGRTILQVLGEQEWERRRPWVERVLAGEQVGFEAVYPRADGPEHLSISYIPLRLDDGSVDGFVVMAYDVTRFRQQAAHFLELSQRDALTGLLNRAGFEAHLEQRPQEPGSGTALLYIDLDHFKAVNDEHGHPVGDQLLRQFAGRLQALVRPSDAVARLGGDEFAIVLAGVREIRHAERVATKVIAAAAQPFIVGELQLQVGASAGVALASGAPGGWQALVAAADRRLYEAKRAGRGRLQL